MSMLAEKKRREKWCLNPRGKAWSEDQNKFGQRLLEKMGWKAGQGLGVNNQGPTDIVKVKMKDDNKGLGFKENGEEWLKTTSEFNQLLDQLGRGADDLGDQSDATSSLEHRSKNSKARVHYHKFTRGKDLSRYSEKDLSSIIGPGVLKPKEEAKADYTVNQINKGSCDEYFKKKAKSKLDNQLVVSDSIEETLDHIKDTDNESSMENNNKLNLVVDSEVAHRKYKKKKLCHSELTTNELLCKNSFDESDPFILKKEKKKRKNQPAKLGEGIQDEEFNSYSEVCEFEDKIPKKKKKLNKEGTLTVNVVNNQSNIPYENIQSVETCTNEEKIAKKKKDKSKKGDFVLEETVESVSNEIVENNEVVSDKITFKKEKKKNRSPDKTLQIEPSSVDVHMVENSEGTSSEMQISEQNVFAQTKISSNSNTKNRKKDSKSKVSKINNVDYSQDPEITKTENDTDVNSIENKSKKKKKKIEKCISEESIDAEISETVYSEKNSKKNKKKLNLDNTLLSEPQKNVSILCAEESFQKQQIVTEKKLKKEMINENFHEENSIENDQVNSFEKSRDFLEAFGRKTSLKKISTPYKKFENDKYETEDFMAFKTSENDPPVGDPQLIKTVPEENIDHYDHNKNRLFLYRIPNNDDCDIPRIILKHENQLVLKKLRDLKISKPDVLVVLNNGDLLSGSIHRKLRLLHKMRYFKTLLPQQAVAEIDKIIGVLYSKSDNATINNQKPKSEITKMKPGKPIELSCTKLPANSNKRNSDTYDESTNCMYIYRDSNNHNNIPKHVAAYEYRLVMARFKKLKITPPNIKVRIIDSKLLNETTHKKLKQIHKSKYLKTLLPSKEVTEIDQSVQMFFDDLKPKIEMMKVIADLEEKTAEIADNLSETEDSKECLHEETKDNKPVKVGFSENIDVLKKMSQQLEVIAKSIGKPSRNESKSSQNASEESIVNSNVSSTTKKGKKCVLNEEQQNVSNCTNIEEKPKSLLQERLEEKLNSLKEQIQMLAEGKKPPSLIKNKPQTISEGNNDGKFWAQSENRIYQNTSYFRGRLAHNVGRQRGGRGCMVMRGRGGARNYMAGSLQDGGFVVDQYSHMLNNDRYFGVGRNVMRRGRGELRGRGREINKNAIPFGGWGALQMYNSGLGQDSVWSHAENFRSGLQRYNQFTMRGRGNFRGRGRGDMIKRGRISQNNYDAKQYAEKCKELNLIPNVCFKGVDLKVIPGYAAGLKADRGDVTNKDNLKSNSDTIKKPNEFSEIIVSKEKNVQNLEVVNEFKEGDK